MLQEHWRTAFVGRPPTAILRDWLSEPASLTKRCQRLCRNFRVRLISQGRIADAAMKGPHWARDVLLECDGEPVIFAHTTLSCMPRGRLACWLARLGERSLGALLFYYPGFSRGKIEYCRLDQRHSLYQRAAQVCRLPPWVWARRSGHFLNGQKVLVTELFLPALLALQGSAPGKK